MYIDYVHPFLTSRQRNWCRLTTAKTESNPCSVIISTASFTWNGWRHGAVAWMLQTTSTSGETRYRRNVMHHTVLQVHPIQGKDKKSNLLQHGVIVISALLTTSQFWDKYLSKMTNLQVHNTLALVQWLSSPKTSDLEGKRKGPSLDTWGTTVKTKF